MSLLLALASCDDEDGTRLGDTDAGAGRGGGGAGGGAPGGSGGGAGDGEGGDGGSGADAGSGGGSGADAGDGGGIPSVALELVASGLVSPIALATPDASGRIFVADRTGVIRIVAADGQLVATPFLDLSALLVELSGNYDERGLLGMAFHPDYAENGRFFVYYSAPLRAEGPDGFDHTSHVSEFTVSADPDLADAGSERIVMQIDQPQSNHNGGQIVFGPDGYLYIPLGDGGGANDVGTGHVEDWYAGNDGGNGQSLDQNLLGKILRIDVDGGEPYAIPSDNPFAGSAMPEIWAYGFRNPFRIAFDRDTGQLFAGDVGQNLMEEVDIVSAGSNYGWNVKEGSRCFSTDSPGTPLSSCPTEDPTGAPLEDPILEYPHSGNADDIFGLSVIGGHVYRGSALPGLTGRYVFGDWSTSFGSPDGQLLVASPPEGGGRLWSFERLPLSDRETLGEYVLSFGEDDAGELYVLTSAEGGPSGTTGNVYRFVP